MQHVFPAGRHRRGLGGQIGIDIDFEPTLLTGHAERMRKFRRLGATEHKEAPRYDRCDREIRVGQDFVKEVLWTRERLITSVASA